MESLETLGTVGMSAPAGYTARARMALALGLLAISSLVLQYGFVGTQAFSIWFHSFDVLAACGFGAILASRLHNAKRPREAWRKWRFEALVFAAFLLALLAVLLLPEDALPGVFSYLEASSRAGLMFGLLKLFLLANVALQVMHAIQRIFVSGIRLELVLAGSFAALILIGTLLLLLPRAGAMADRPISLLDAFFTATSAACVTGLAVRDTGAEFSTLGQAIILALFQVGGLGIVTFVAFISAFSAKTLPVPQMVAFRQMINAPAMGDLKGRLAGILLLTLSIEGAGALSLFLTLPSGKEGFDRLFWSVFHAVSAFCNAGFSLETTGLEFARGHTGINWTIMLLITLGSLGFLVLPELIGLTVAAMRRLPLLLQRRTRMFLPPLGRRLSVQSRLSILVTVSLIVIGTVAFWLLEANHSLAGRPMTENFLVSAFQSITTRTAGFNSVDIGALTQATLLMMMMLMVIGGCPVSTGGGVKTVTIGVLILALRSMILRKEKVEAFGRTLPARAFFTALNVFVLYSVTAAVCVFLLAVFDPQVGLRQTLFETVSALSTVGLSTGITAGLSDASKLVLCAAMFIGRIGPIALVFSVFEARHKVDYQYPTEDVVVG